MEARSIPSALESGLVNFTYAAPPSRVVFGAGRIRELTAEVERLGAKRVFLICTPGRAQRVKALSAGLPLAGVFAEAAMHTPLALAEKARQQAQAVEADVCVAVGGGSTIGFGKAIALTAGLPVVAVPTTYSGSEMTTIWGTSEGGAKKTGRDPKVLPKTVLYDPELTLELPSAVSAASGMNAIAHCAEALYAYDGNPVISLIAEEGIRALASALPRIVSAPRDLAAREQALYGAWLAGMSIGTTSVALHHKLCHVLGGYGLPHAETHSIVLPHAVAYNAAAAPEAMLRMRRALGSSDAAAGLYALQRELGIPRGLADLGMKETDLEPAARIAVQAPYPNPRKVEYEPVLRLLQDAYAGRAPGAG
jgi:alcohol dehydrogenase class IV